MTVLLQGGGGVSTFALQFAKMFGAGVIMLSSSAERCALLRKMGADEAIDYNAEPEWDKAVRTLTGGQGVDLTVEVSGAETVERSLLATRTAGKLAIVGLLTGRSNAVQSLASSGVETFSTKVGSRQDYEAMNRAVAYHKSRPTIAAPIVSISYTMRWTISKAGCSLAKSFSTLLEVTLFRIRAPS